MLISDCKKLALGWSKKGYGGDLDLGKITQKLEVAQKNHRYIELDKINEMKFFRKSVWADYGR